MQNANRATKKCKWDACLPNGAHPGRTPVQDAALKVMDGACAPHPGQLSVSHCLLEDLGDRILTIASEPFCYSATDLPSFKCSQESVRGISSFLSV